MKVEVITLYNGVKVSGSAGDDITLFKDDSGIKLDFTSFSELLRVAKLIGWMA